MQDVASKLTSIELGGGLSDLRGGKGGGGGQSGGDDGERLHFER